MSMTADIADQLGQAAALPSRPVDVAGLLQRAAWRRRRRHAAAATVGLVGIAGAAIVFSTLRSEHDGPQIAATYPGTRTVIAADGNVLPRPDAGTVVPGALNDGTRVFTVAHESGAITVVEAVSTHVTIAVKQIGWCQRAGTFEDEWHGSRWDDHGRYVFGPAPTDLNTFAVSVDGDSVRVLERRPGTQRSAPGPIGDGVSCSAMGHDLRAMLLPDWPLPATKRARLQDLDQQPPDDLVAVDAFMEAGHLDPATGLRVVRLCTEAVAGADLTQSECGGVTRDFSVDAAHYAAQDSGGVGPVGVLMRAGERQWSKVVLLPHGCTLTPCRP
jgi:Rieske Fe-S protein